MRLLQRLRDLLGTPTTGAPTQQPAESRQDVPQYASAFDDIIVGYEYSATLQLRTPLYILLQHRRFVAKHPDGPPVVSSEMWHGIWLPKAGPIIEGVKFEYSMASEAGSIPSDGGDYLPFLIAVRRITEGDSSVQAKEESLRLLSNELGPAGTPYSSFIDADSLVERALPRTVDMLPVPSARRRTLLAMGVRNLADVKRYSDADLLAIKGIGPKSVVAIRDFLARTDLDPAAERYLAEAFRAPRAASPAA